MSRLNFDSLNYSHSAGMFTISGKNYLTVSNLMRSVDGIDGVEHDEENQEYTFTYNKIIIEQDHVKTIFKKLK